MSIVTRTLSVLVFIDICNYSLAKQKHVCYLQTQPLSLCILLVPEDMLYFVKQRHRIQLGYFNSLCVFCFVSMVTGNYIRIHDCVTGSRAINIRCLINQENWNCARCNLESYWENTKVSTKLWTEENSNRGLCLIIIVCELLNVYCLGLLFDYLTNNDKDQTHRRTTAKYIYLIKSFIVVYF